MESKNVIAAIALSSAVIVLYSLFFVPEQPKPSKNLDEKKIEQNRGKRPNKKGGKVKIQVCIVNIHCIGWLPPFSRR